MKNVFWLLIAFQIKHFLCDYPLQGKYMLGKFKPNFRDWIGPLWSHATVHCIGSSIIVIAWVQVMKVTSPWQIGLLPTADFIIHFTVDRIKASPNMLGRWKPDSRYFWWALGADQMAHHLTHYAIIAVLVLS